MPKHSAKEPEHPTPPVQFTSRIWWINMGADGGVPHLPQQLRNPSNQEKQAISGQQERCDRNGCSDFLAGWFESSGTYLDQNSQGAMKIGITDFENRPPLSRASTGAAAQRIEGIQLNSSISSTFP